MIDWLLIGCIVGAVILVPILILIFMRVCSRLTVGKTRAENRVDGKTIIITGANSGIGKRTAERLAERGGRIILACRSLQKANAAADDIRQLYPNSEVAVRQLDLCNFESIRSFAAKILREEGRLDILINNAGMSGGEFHLTKDGFDELYQANYLGSVLLTDLLVPLLKKSSPARIINTGSAALMSGSVNVDTFADDVKSPYRQNMIRYGSTKLAMAMWTRALAEELLASGVTVNVVHPGVVKTPFAVASGSTLSNSVFSTVIAVTGRTDEEGAQTLIHLALSDDGQNISGRYWAECKPAYVPRYPSDMEKNRKLLKVTREILKNHGQSPEHQNELTITTIR